MKLPAAFIFDMDGVIISSTDTHTDAWREYLRRHGIEQPYIADRMLGKHNDHIVREFFASSALTAEDVLRHGAGKEALYRELMAPVLDSRIVPGAVEFLSRYSGLPMAVASNAEPANVEFVLDLTGIRQYFTAIVNGHDVARPKPAPDIFLHAAALMGVPPDECVVFEDSATGIAAARAAGMRVVALLTTLSEFDNVELAIADFRDPRLEQWLAANFSLQPS